ncbi:reverse transcriptase domain-containing protein [Tanacetum coccineum]
MSNYQAPIKQNQSVPLSELEKIKKTNEANIKAMQNQINNVKNELRNEMQNSIQTSMSNQTKELKNMMASFFQINTASTLGTGSLPSNTVANLKGELKAITTRSGLVLDGPTVPMPPPFINLKEDERVEETLTDPEHGEFTIKVPPPLVQKAKPPSQRNYVVHQRDPRYPHIPYPSRMNQEKRQEKDEVQIHKFWQMFKQLHINISLADALVLIPKYQKMLKSLLSNKEKLLELANTPLNENCSAIILKKLLEKLGDPGKFLIPCGFSELKCKALADLGASINLMPLSVWKKLGLPELISTQMTLELANRTICTPEGIARDVFVPVGKFTFPTDFVIVDYENDLVNPSSPLPPFHKLFKCSSSTTYSSPSLPISETSDYSLEEFADELAHITFPPGNDDLPVYIESDLREIEYLLNHNPIEEMDSILEDSVDYPDDNLVDTILPFTVNDNVYDDPFDFKEEKIKESKLLIDELDHPKSSIFLPSPECDLVFYEDFSEVDALPSTNNEDKVFNPGILIHKIHFEVTNCATPDKDVKKISYASLILEDFNLLSLYELPFHKEVPSHLGLEKLDQTVLGKDYSNLLIADSLLKTIWFINAPCYGNEALASPKANDSAYTISIHSQCFSIVNLYLYKLAITLSRLQRSVQFGTHTYDSDCDDLSTAQAVLMTSISNYGSDVILEVPNFETYLNDMDNQSVHALQDFEQSPVMDFTDNEISSDSNIIPYSQYLQETQQATVQDANLQAQQDLMILSVIKQMSEQMINHVNN